MSGDVVRAPVSGFTQSTSGRIAAAGEPVDVAGMIAVPSAAPSGVGMRGDATAAPVAARKPRRLNAPPCPVCSLMEKILLMPDAMVPRGSGAAGEYPRTRP
ncbi:hypothetical protein GCM10022207_63400 [Streptomyces lannensis]|uniref:Uncharacterized protein n=1 Tax=Streptomyces lannensis TaxID=766498 RepID=A0ABP7KU84_9ACTN